MSCTKIRKSKLFWRNIKHWFRYRGD